MKSTPDPYDGNTSYGRGFFYHEKHGKKPGQTICRRMYRLAPHGRNPACFGGFCGRKDKDQPETDACAVGLRSSSGYSSCIQASHEKRKREASSPGGRSAISGRLVSASDPRLFDLRK